MTDSVQKLTLKDFTSDQEVRWCPGCGDYAILKTMQKLLPEIDTPKENTVFIWSSVSIGRPGPLSWTRNQSASSVTVISGSTPAISAASKALSINSLSSASGHFARAGESVLQSA